MANKTAITKNVDNTNVVKKEKKTNKKDVNPSNKKVISEKKKVTCEKRKISFDIIELLDGKVNKRIVFCGFILLIYMCCEISSIQL